MKFIKFFSIFLFPLLSGLLLFLAFPRYDLSWLAWIGFVPLLLRIREMKPWQALLMGWFAGVVFFLGITTWWLQEFKAVSIFASGLGYLYLGIYFGIFSFLMTQIRNRTTLPSLVAAPLWVTIEYIRANLSFLAFPWALLGHSQYVNLPIIQMASVTGIYGVSFIVMLVNGALADLLVHFFSPSPCPSPPRLSLFDGLKAQSLSKGSSQAARGEEKKWIIGKIKSGGLPDGARKAAYRLAVVLFIVVGICIAGWTSLFPEPGGKPLKVAVVQGNIPQKMKWDRMHRDEILSRYEALSREAARENPDLIIWPETATPGFILKNVDLYSRVVSLVRALGTPFLIGSAEYPKFLKGETQGQKSGNTAIYFSPEGRVTGQYLKIRLVPFGEYAPLEGFITWPEFIIKVDRQRFEMPGREQTLFPLKGTRIGNLICWEVLFPYLMRQAVKKGAGLVVNLSNEAWFGKTDFPYQMLASCVFRAVENRVNLVRATNTGISCFIDPNGRITGRVNKASHETFVDGTLTKTIFVNRPGTFYTYFGDILVYLSSGFTVFMLIYSWLKRKNSNSITT
jgi:apolipoprotein N-acyltransferase